MASIDGLNGDERSGIDGEKELPPEISSVFPAIVQATLESLS